MYVGIRDFHYAREKMYIHTWYRIGNVYLAWRGHYRGTLRVRSQRIKQQSVTPFTFIGLSTAVSKFHRAD